jgi:hypothetical protein
MALEVTLVCYIYHIAVTAYSMVKMPPDDHRGLGIHSACLIGVLDSGSVQSGGPPGFRLRAWTLGVMIDSMPKVRSLSRFAKAAVSLEVFLSVGALGGGGALILGPRGEIIPIPLWALKGSPFENYFVPGLILLCALGLGPLVAAWLAWRRHPLAPIAALGVGVTLLIWMAVEVAIVGYTNRPPLQPFYFLLGAVISGVGLSWRISLGPSARRSE